MDPLKFYFNCAYERDTAMHKKLAKKCDNRLEGDSSSHASDDTNPSMVDLWHKSPILVEFFVNFCIPIWQPNHTKELGLDLDTSP